MWLHEAEAGHRASGAGTGAGQRRSPARRSRSSARAPWPVLAILAACLAAAPLARAVDDLSSELRAALGLTGQGAAVAVVGVDAKTGQTTVVAQGAAGVRRVGYTAPVTSTDVFLVASCGKSMTASLFGMLVTQGKVAWTDTIGAVLKRGGIDTTALNPKLLAATVSHLLSHRAGFSGDDYTWMLPSQLQAQLTPGTPANAVLTARQQRQALSLWQLARKPAQRLGKFSYSNAGYETAAWLAEVAAGPGATYEGMLTSLLAEAGVSDLTFWYPSNYGSWVAPPGGGDPTLAPAAPQTPIGHDCSDRSGLTAQTYDWTAAAPSMYGSGGMGVSAISLAKWVAYHIKGLLGLLPAGASISPAAFAELHRPWVRPDASNDGDYAKGWSNDTADGTPMLSHNGLYGGFQSNMYGYLGNGPGGTAAPGTASRLVAVAAITNLDGDEGKAGGQCSRAASKVLDTLTITLGNRYWDA